MTSSIPDILDPWTLAPDVIRAVVDYLDAADSAQVRTLYSRVFGQHAVRPDTPTGNAVMREILRDHCTQTIRMLGLLTIHPVASSARDAA